MKKYRLLLGFAVALASILSGCTAPAPRVITPPALLVEPVAKPIKPNPRTATQKDVAVYLVELKGALELANLKLTLIKQWGEKWTR